MKPVDADTGEVLISQTVYRREGEVIVAFDPKHTTRNIKHVRVRTARQQKRVYDKLTLEERGFLFSLLPYLQWETNIVVGDGEIAEKGVPLAFTYIDAIVGISKPTRIKIVRSLIDKKVLGFLTVSGKKVAIVVNPSYVIRGRKMNDTIKKAFECDVDVEE